MKTLAPQILTVAFASIGTGSRERVSHVVRSAEVDRSAAPRHLAAGRINFQIVVTLHAVDDE
jgi:hypothetical protein